MGRIARLWRTVRWLRREQLAGRAHLLLRQHLVRPRIDARPAPPRRLPAGRWTEPPQRQASLTGPSRFHFLSQQVELAEVGWDNAELPLLWRYNQHYFDDLNAADAVHRRQWHVDLLDRWLIENPPPRGTAWAPFPTSLRIVNWIKWFLSGQSAECRWLDSLALQVRWLRQTLEWHLLGNHLFANAKALVFAGLFFDGDEAKSWLDCGLQILDRELPEQILADGGQFERSPMYHALALEDVLDLLNAHQMFATAPTPADWAGRLRRKGAEMLHWLRCMRHADGTLVRFNDCADGIAPPTRALERYAEALGVRGEQIAADGLTHLSSSGYIRMQRCAAMAWLDIAPIGPDYLPGHAHADTLSFELDVRGRGLIVNRGTSVYGQGPRRDLERGTAAHSTLQVGSHDSSEVWSGFRVGRRARVGKVVLGDWFAEAEHDGFRHLPGRPIHRRRWSLEADRLRVDDRLASTRPAAATVRYHFAPGLQLSPEGTRTWRVHDAAGTWAHFELAAGVSPRIEAWDHALRFGICVPAQCLAIDLDDNRASAILHWES